MSFRRMRGKIMSLFEKSIGAVGAGLAIIAMAALVILFLLLVLAFLFPVMIQIDDEAIFSIMGKLVIYLIIFTVGAAANKWASS